MKHHLLRIVQEATTNAVRHAGARRIVIELKYGGGTVTLVVSDHGTGFSPDDARSKKIGHFGLRGIRGRTKKLGGELLIQSSLGAGTVVRVVVPILADKVVLKPEHAKTREDKKNPDFDRRRSYGPAHGTDDSSER